MTFRDYYELADPLVLPIRGKAYTIPPATAGDVVRWRRFTEKVEQIAAGATDVTITEDEAISDEQYQRMFLGSALDEMRADGIHPGVIEHAATTAMGDTMAGREAAERMWNSIDPKASKPEPTAAPEKDSTPSPSTGAASSTSSRARTSGTRSPRKSQAGGRQRAGAKSSPGSTSSRSTSSGTSTSD
ncbi:DUF7426 family protein [Curtobacterium sp. 22159]|uniref:DUF7426 family protein n=1 Tax=Curtobacterium sp. 22159 TaxID=3453882 RepID=UPI003F832BE4